jgi:glycosyltransferase involved in cell wall biosynthesis
MSDDAAPRFPTTSVVIPVFQGERSLPELVDRLRAVLAPLTPAFEILLVDDGSADDSWRVIRELAEAHPEVTGIGLSRNFGQHNALLAGIRMAAFDVVLTMDDDLQHPPEELPKLFAALAEDVDLVYGYPSVENHSLARNVMSRATKRALAASMDAEVAVHVSALRLFRTELRDGFAHVVDPFLSIDVLLSWVSSRVEAVPVDMADRKYGRSNYNLARLARAALNLVTGFTVLPLRIVAALGFVLSLVGAAIFFYVLGFYATHRSESLPGFPFLASVIAVFSGAQLLSLGVIGEYLGRMHYRSMQRPVYLVRRTAASTSNPSPVEP